MSELFIKSELSISKSELNDNNFNPEIKKFLEDKKLSLEEAKVLNKVIENRKNIYKITWNNLKSLRSYISSKSKIWWITDKDIKALNIYIQKLEKNKEIKIKPVIKKTIITEKGEKITPKITDVIKNPEKIDNNYISEEWILKNVKKISLKWLIEDNSNLELFKKLWITNEKLSIKRNWKIYNIEKVNNVYVYDSWAKIWRKVFIYDWDKIWKYEEKLWTENISYDWVLKDVEKKSLKKLFKNKENLALLKKLWIKTSEFSIINNNWKKDNVVAGEKSFFYKTGINKWRKVSIYDWNKIWKFENNIKTIDNWIEITEEEKKLLNFISDIELPIQKKRNPNILFWDNIWDKIPIVLKDNSIKQVVEFLSKIKWHTAIWLYQINKGSIERMVDIFWPETKVTENIQSKMAYALLVKCWLLEYKEGKITTGDFVNKLTREWSALPYKNNKGIIQSRNKWIWKNRVIKSYKNFKWNEALTEKYKDFLNLVKQIKS